MAASQPGTSSSAQKADNRIFLFRLQMLIIDGGLTCLRNYVDQKLAAKSSTLSACLANEQAQINFLKGRKIITQVQYDLLYPSSGTVSTSDLDITLIICLMRNLTCFNLNTKFKWDTPPAQNDTSIEADICRLKFFRNEICHISTTTGIQHNDFIQKWNEIEQILLRIDTVYPIKDFQQTINEFLFCTLDPSTEKRVTDEIEKWNKFDKSVKTDLEQLKTGQKVMKQSIDAQNIELAETRKRMSENTDELKTVNVKIAKIESQLPAEDNYQQRKLEFQGDLIKFYRKKCSSIPLSPLLEEIETPLAGFYVMPDIVAVKQKSLTCHEEERTPIKSLKDLFSTGSGDQQEIYLSADAGFGKTAFSKYLAVTWCQAHCHDENYACFKDDELKTLFDFKFLFLVLLRDCTSVCNIDDMIEQQITTKLPTSAKLDEVLRREKCLIILDGLDEWTHPDNSCSEVTEKIPHRYVRDNCAILTTTRPWKLGIANLKSSQINKKVELVQLSADSTRQLEENAIRKMTGVRDDRVLESKIWDFNEVIRDRHLEHMQVIPLLLMYIVCLWCNNIPIGNSKHEIYTNIIEFLLSRTSKKHPEVQPSRESSASEIPEYFKSHEFCKKFYSLITSLAELAYQTLFHENRENTLVFDRTVAEKYLKADDIKLSLLSGILSESRSKTLIKEITKLSFSHKTVQEFFAAIFISSQNDAQKIVVEKCRNIQDILDMSKICEFISKMNADRMCEISNDLMSVINEDEKTRDYRTRTGDENMYNTPLYNIQKMFMSCLQEMPESENIQLCLQDFFIDKYTEDSKLLQRLLKQNKTNIKSLYIDIRILPAVYVKL
ncbi:uncharacterized protein LOC132722532 [Ruditapes philippinarum]|uniref:uncharacterized protein LOC132722532 n=1 Tax=Ruditapes philippinarum TaxID=129788 RepID=UPI00295A79E3|nr:uncharacterized protein LOC132722532 [Ruditapes philippinarum]